jgi:hypothetical protein
MKNPCNERKLLLNTSIMPARCCETTKIYKPHKLRKIRDSGGDFVSMSDTMFMVQVKNKDTKSAN